jgi:signal transduction histidine kinase
MEMHLAGMRRRLMENREMERHALAQELHDLPIQELRVAQMELEAFAEFLSDRHGLAKLEAARARLKEVGRMLRAFCNELRPPTLVYFGLGPAVSGLVKTFQKVHPDLDVELDLALDDTILPRLTELVLFRICQHGLANIAQHARASTVRIRLSSGPRQVVLTLKDDGCGFTVPRHWPELALDGRLGLASMAERMESVGGTLELVSVPGEGTLLRAQLPRDAQHGPDRSGAQPSVADELSVPLRSRRDYGQ